MTEHKYFSPFSEFLLLAHFHIKAQAGCKKCESIEMEASK